MKLIADSGSTKTDWCLVSKDQAFDFQTQGINPFHQSRPEIHSILETELAPQFPREAIVTSIDFYGAGCTPEQSPRLAEALHAVFGADTDVSVGSDMLGAARSLCQHDEGIACILGTGANSCLYDGRDIVSNVSPLGYILGDEGSGAYIGKRLIGDVLKQQLSPRICQLFHDETQLDGPTIIRKVYREAVPNRFLGQVSQFCHRHREEPEIQHLLVDCFTQFFTRNVVNYQRPDLPVNFVGSIAWFYADEIRLAAQPLGLNIGTIVRAPMAGLIEYHG